LPGKIERTEIRLVLLFAFLAWVFSRKQFIQFMQELNPVEVLILWYVGMFIFIHLLLRGVGFTIGRLTVPRWGLRHTVGVLSFAFCFFITWNWCESSWASLALGGSGDLPTILVGTEDGALFWLWWNYLKTNVSFPYFIWTDAAEMAADLTYPVGAFISALIGVWCFSPQAIKGVLGKLFQLG